MRGVLESGAGLQHAENYHMLCRMLGSLRDLSPLTEDGGSMADYTSWVGLAANFTMRALHDVHLPPNNLHYLLGTWGRLAAGAGGGGGGAGGSRSPHNALLARIISLQSGQIDDDADDSDARTGSTGEIVQDAVGKVVVAYLEGRLEAIAASHDGACEDPLDDPEMLQGQLEILPKLCGSRYKEIAADLLRILDHHHDMYGRMLSSQGGGGDDRLRVEGQLAWLVRVCAGLIGGHYVVEKRVEIDGSFVRPTAVVAPNMQEGDQLTDADVTRRVLQLVLLLQQEGGSVRCDSRLELALLSFLDQLKQVHRP
jgi:hypothetical protein